MFQFVNNMVTLFFLFDCFFLSFPYSEFFSEMLQMPLFEWSRVNLNDTIFDKSISSDQIIIRSIIDDISNLGFSSDAHRLPVEVSIISS